MVTLFKGRSDYPYDGSAKVSSGEKSVEGKYRFGATDLLMLTLPRNATSRDVETTAYIVRPATNETSERLLIPVGEVYR